MKTNRARVLMSFNAVQAIVGPAIYTHSTNMLVAKATRTWRGSRGYDLGLIRTSLLDIAL